MREHSPIDGATHSVSTYSFSRVLAAAQQSEGWAFEYLFSVYSGRLAAYAQARGSSNPEAITNAALYEVFQAISGTSDDEDAFACRIFQHTRRKLIEEEERSIGLAERHAAADVTELRPASQQRLFQVLDALDSEHLDVVLLRVLGDFSAAQTGVIINRPIHAVKVLQLNALQELSDRLAEQAAV